MYHRVARVDRDPWRLAVTPAHFDEHLSVIRTRFRPWSLGELADALEHGSVPRRSVVVTFDDGYRDNVLVAKPLLERYELPATVFVVSAYVDSDRDFWWDELVELAQRASLPELDNLRELRERLRPLPHAERLAALDALRERAGIERPPATLTPTSEDITSLAATELIEVGAHTATHAYLPDLRREARLEEISSGKEALDRLLGRATESFSYPHGGFDTTTAELVQESGFRRACAGMLGPVTASTPLFAIPRIHVEDMSGPAFGRLLDRWLVA